ncbi:3-isopropylmalate dehydratase small subunit [Blattabacterium cuenoti]|uniref:3-isopropylmalate dehydratase small subunit n=1 Tax=Blattabacterium cuenoti TaxID=1653831 RepID=UPI00163B8146|nr:3-isopropylmalate dehydratase small subunit [Blattabacterium cuenoti]
MKKFRILVSTIIPLPMEDIDTDQIIPSRFLKESNRKIYSKNLFVDWRYNKDGSINKDFILNNKKLRGKILLSGRNFGCGSSREHAVWSILDYGFQAIISSFFADIFKENSLNNGLLPVEVSDFFLKKLFDFTKNNPQAKIKIDLINQQVVIIDTKEYEHFHIHPYKKTCFLYGYDDLDFLVGMKKEIEDFEKKRKISF